MSSTEYLLTRARRGAVWLLLSVAVILSPVSLAKDELLSGFPAPQQDFNQHIADMRAYLLATQLPDRVPSDVEYNLPFQIAASEGVPYRGKFLLIHGLDDSPAVWKDFASELALRGYYVRAILLPGHGNTPDAQLDVSYTMWLDAARSHLELWHSKDDALHIGGFSLGGVIATALALEYEGIDGLLLFAPAYYSTRNNLLRWASLASRFQDYVFGGKIIEDNPTKYNSIPINAAAQYYKSSRYLKRIWKDRQLDMPVLMIESFDDSVVSVDSVRRIFEHRFSSPRKRLVLYGNDDVQPKPSEVIRQSRIPKYRILNQSHQSMLISPDNPLFGVNGTVLVCNGNEWEIFSACLYYEDGSHWRGAEGTTSPDGVPVARTTFNPDFEFLLEQFEFVFIGEDK